MSHVIERASLRTARLLLRPFRAEDAAAVQELAGDRAIAENTLSIPHPYPDGAAAEWIETHAEQRATGRPAPFAIERAADGRLIGATGLELEPEHEAAELGYWIGKPFWGRGYGTEAARAMLDYGFRELGLHRVHARHFVRNPASGRVLEKIGMRHEGSQRQAIKKWGEYLDVELFAILRAEWQPEAGR